MTTANSCNEPNSETRALEAPFCHHVFFWLNNPDNEQERADFEKGIEKLLEIPEIKAYHFGTPADVPERPVLDNSYTYSYAVFFESTQAHDIYQEHPLHLEFIENNKHLWEKVQVFDSLSK
ncbi:MAG: Dabb family protein [Bacteroidota bacterium]